jgi:hypothetical protein
MGPIKNTTIITTTTGAAAPRGGEIDGVAGVSLPRVAVGSLQVHATALHAADKPCDAADDYQRNDDDDKKCERVHDAGKITNQ